MKILITSPTFPPFNSGLGNAAALQAKLLVKCGASVTVATFGDQRNTLFHPDGYMVEQFSVQGADFIATPLKGDVAAYLEYLIRTSFDLILMNAWQNWATDICLLNLNQVPGKKVLYSHGLATWVVLRPAFFRTLVRSVLWQPYAFKLRTLLTSLDGFFALAPQGCDTRFSDVKLARRLGLTVDVVPNALPDHMGAVLDSPAATHAERNELVSIGAYHWTKGHDLVLKAFAASRARTSHKLVFYGQEFNSETDRLRQMSSALGLDGHVEFRAGYSGPQLMGVYKNALAFLSGSHTECQPLVLLDAMAAGTPFIAKATGCIPYLAGGVSVSSSAEMALQIDQLVFQQDVWQALSLQGRTAALKEHSQSSVQQNLWAAVSRVMAR